MGPLAHHAPHHTLMCPAAPLHMCTASCSPSHQLANRGRIAPVHSPSPAGEDPSWALLVQPGAPQRLLRTERDRGRGRHTSRRQRRQRGERESMSGAWGSLQPALVCHKNTSCVWGCVPCRGGPASVGRYRRHGRVCGGPRPVGKGGEPGRWGRVPHRVVVVARAGCPGLLGVSVEQGNVEWGLKSGD